MKPERIVLVRGNRSNWYEQAIFIIKKDAPPNKIPVDFVGEAEKIIYNYMQNNKTSKLPAYKGFPLKKAKSLQTFDLVLNTIMLLSCVFIAAMLLWRFT